MLQLIGLVALVPMSVRLAIWGRRRALPRPWMAWLPLGAPVIWLLGSLTTALAVRDRFSDIGAMPADQRSTALSEGIAGALQHTLAGGIAAVILLFGCFAFFSFVPRKPEPSFSDDPQSEARATG